VRERVPKTVIGAGGQFAATGCHAPHGLDWDPACVASIVTIPGPPLSLAMISLNVLPKPESRAE